MKNISSQKLKISAALIKKNTVRGSDFWRFSENHKSDVIFGNKRVIFDPNLLVTLRTVNIRIVIFETPGAKLFSFPIGIKYSFLNILLD